MDGVWNTEEGQNITMGAPTKTASKILVGRPIQDSELEKSRQKRGNKLRPVLLVSEMHEKEEQQRTRVAPKEIIFDPPQQNLMFDYRVHRGSTRVPSMVRPCLKFPLTEVICYYLLLTDLVSEGISLTRIFLYLLEAF